MPLVCWHRPLHMFTLVHLPYGQIGAAAVDGCSSPPRIAYHHLKTSSATLLERCLLLLSTAALLGIL